MNVHQSSASAPKFEFGVIVSSAWPASKQMRHMLFESCRMLPEVNLACLPNGHSTSLTCLPSRSVQAAGACGPGHRVLQTNLGSGVGCTDFALHGALARSALSCDCTAADRKDCSCKSRHGNLGHLVLLLGLNQAEPTLLLGQVLSALRQESRTIYAESGGAPVKDVCCHWRFERARAFLPVVAVLRCRQPVGGLLTGWPGVVGTRWRKWMWP